MEAPPAAAVACADPLAEHASVDAQLHGGYPEDAEVAAIAGACDTAVVGSFLEHVSCPRPPSRKVMSAQDLGRTHLGYCFLPDSRKARAGARSADGSAHSHFLLGDESWEEEDEQGGIAATPRAIEAMPTRLRTASGDSRESGDSASGAI
eukprot:TRINITY_DN16876_c0_g7_i1.p2 TRINITY_DN16876_c0_g7~~TRINITY_DN16876_c0_g7_i1.p2  ORF type:complete len:175 (+),score=30.96 TRINITY_DN16876_c0_g7_i1:77-526(+)